MMEEKENMVVKFGDFTIEDYSDSERQFEGSKNVISKEEYKKIVLERLSSEIDTAYKNLQKISKSHYEDGVLGAYMAYRTLSEDLPHDIIVSMVNFDAAVIDFYLEKYHED